MPAWRKFLRQTNGVKGHPFQIGSQVTLRPGALEACGIYAGLIYTVVDQCEEYVGQEDDVSSGAMFRIRLAEACQCNHAYDAANFGQIG